MASDHQDSGSRSLLAVILAAGEGTRMMSARPKVLHEIAGRSLLAHVLASVTGARAAAAAVVVGPGRDDVAQEAAGVYPGVHIRVQEKRAGTAHAVLAARDLIAQGFDDIVVLFADTPLIRPETLARLRDRLAAGAAVAVLGFETADPTGYGRLIVEDGRLLAIREQKDASAAERAIGLCNGGVMGLAGGHALELLTSVGADNAQQEFYLTDVVALARARGLEAVVARVDADEIAGVNDRVQLAAAEALLQRRLRRAAMMAGVSLSAPDTVYLSADTRLAPDVLVEPHVVFGPGVTVESGAVIHAFSHLEGAHIGPGASVGPFARLRPGTKLAAKARIGNFVEVKNADIGEGAKLNHLTYAGDAAIGAGANLGAGTITCNYDGFGKYRTEIGAGAFIGSNSALVAPVTIGAGAYIGSGSVITQDVPADALALGRSRQVTREGWAAALRANRTKLKA